MQNWHSLLEKYESILSKTNIILIPDLNDYFVPLFPKPNLPQFLLDIISTKKVNVISVSNPATLIIRGKQITFFKADLGGIYRKSQLLINNNDSDSEMISKNIESTIRSQ